MDEHEDRPTEHEGDPAVPTSTPPSSETPPAPPPPPPPPVAGPYVGPPPVRSASNGMGTAAMVLGIVGLVLGFIPFLFFFAFVCGVLALIFGGIGMSRARQTGVGRGQSIAGLILGGVACLLGVVGLTILVTSVDEIQGELDRIGQELDGAFRSVRFRLGR
jgi:hypothetical protein